MNVFILETHPHIEDLGHPLLHPGADIGYLNSVAGYGGPDGHLQASLQDVGGHLVDLPRAHHLGGHYEVGAAGDKWRIKVKGKHFN